MNSHDQRRANDVKGLTFVQDFGWLRAPELGKLMWPGSASSRQAADRLMRGWVARQLVIARDLPDRTGRAVVLATAGVRLLGEQGKAASTGKDIGTMTAEGWTPSSTWRHDLIATGVLCELRRRGYRVIPERMLRTLQGNRPSIKIPDGLAQEPGQHGQGRWLWLEVENARKTGPHMARLAQAIAHIGRGSIEIARYVPQAAMVAYPNGILDEKGHRIDHEGRVRRAVERLSRQEVSIQFVRCTMNGTGVEAVTIERETVAPDKAAAVLKVLDANGWREIDGLLASHYGKLQAQVWENGEDGQCPWSYDVEGHAISGQAGYAETITAAKRLAAERIASL